MNRAAAGLTALWSSEGHFTHLSRCEFESGVSPVAVCFSPTSVSRTCCLIPLFRSIDEVDDIKGRDKRKENVIKDVRIKTF